MDAESDTEKRGCLQKAEGETVLDRNGIDEYLHTYYEDIEAIHREGIFQLSSSYNT